MLCYLMVTLSRNIESPLFILSLSTSVLRVGNYFSVPHFLLLVPLFPSFLSLSLPFLLLSLFLFFLFFGGISSSLSLSLSLFILLNFVALNMNYLRATTTGVWCMHVALYLMLPTVLIRLHLVINQC